MRLHHLGLAALILACALPATFAVAADAPAEKAVMADSADTFAAVADTIRSEMKPGGRYEFIRPHERGEVESGLDGMTALLGKSGSVAAMNHDDKIRLFNLQEQVNGILTRSDSNYLVCERHAPVGSNIPLTTCKPYGEIERKRLSTQKYLEKTQMDQSTCTGSKACRSN